MNKIKIQHPSCFVLKQNGGYAEIRATFAVECSDNETKIAASFCSGNDQFQRKTGRLAATERLTSDPIVLPFDVRKAPKGAIDTIVREALNQNGPTKKWWPRSIVSLITI